MYLLELAPLGVEIVVVYALGWDVEGDVLEITESILADVNRENGISIYLLKITLLVFVNSFISTVYGLKGRKMMARIL